MEQNNETGSTASMSQGSSEVPTRKGLHRFFHVSRLDWYLSVVIAIFFTILGAIELFDIANLRFIRMGNSFQFAMLFAIFGMVSKIYYRMFEEQYDKRKG
jgi:energy-coupling factor transporter transmembrane protein EcfT